MPTKLDRFNKYHAETVNTVISKWPANMFANKRIAKVTGRIMMVDNNSIGVRSG